MIILNKRLLMIGLGTLMLLSIPLIAMQFTNEVQWSLFDFMVAGALVFGTGFLIELIIRNVNKKRNRILMTIVAIAALVLVWLEMAVGIFGTPIAGS